LVLQLKEFEFYREIFFGILAKIVNQLCAFGRDLVDVGGCLIDVVVERFIG